MIQKVFIANRGEIAIRIARAAHDMNIAAAGCYAGDDARALHVARIDECVALPGTGADAYLNIASIIEAARKTGSDAVHPGYGFLSENSAFAKACTEAGLIFIGPSPDTLDLFGDKSRARNFARKMNIPLLPGSPEAIDLAGARDFLRQQGPDGAIMLKAVAGGGGRGMRAIFSAEQLEQEFATCQSEARAAFGRADLYAERFIRRAKHLEVQTIGDGLEAIALGERECTLQRRFQKIVEIAPSPSISDTLRQKITDASICLAQEAGLASLCTFEYLIDADDPETFFFMEANPRVQVEHTITEEVFDIDLVQAQIAIAGGKKLSDPGVLPNRQQNPGGFAIQLRLNAETLNEKGDIRPAFGTIEVFEMPAGPGIRTDSGAYAGYTVNPSYDSLLAKIIVHNRDQNFGQTLRRARRALADVRVEGIRTNIDLLHTLLLREEVETGDIDTRFIERNAAAMNKSSRLDSGFFQHRILTGKDRKNEVPDGLAAYQAPTGGRIAELKVREGEILRPGAPVAIIEAMKMEHLATSTVGGIIRQVLVREGDVVQENTAILFIEPTDIAGLSEVIEEIIDPDFIRPDLAEVKERTALTLDERRPEAVNKRHSKGLRTTRENLSELFDRDSFVEYGAFAIAAQRRRRELDDLIVNTPADGVITGIGTINADLFGPEASRAAVVAYDYTVLAGTQGTFSHKKTDRLLELAGQWRTPVVIYAEGGGGRPGDVDRLKISGLDVPTFASVARISGKAPLVGIVSGRCFAGNAALAGCCDVIIATENSNLGMSGPAMIEGGGLGIFRPEEIGPIDVQTGNGVVDIAVADETEATLTAKKYLSYFQGRLSDWEFGDQRLLRHIVPENRLRVYAVRDVMDALFDRDSVLEIRPTFGKGIVTSLARIEGRPVGVIANDPTWLGGAIDGDAADKASRFMRLCEAYGLAMISLIDTPGFMVGPDVEAEAQVRRVCRMYLAGSRMTTPFISVVLRKGYGLGAQAMACGGFGEPAQIFSWPTGEFGGMNLEGAVRLGFRKEMEAIEDAEKREEFFRTALNDYKEQGKAINVASFLEIDAVIDPADTRNQIVRLLNAMPKRQPSHSGPLPFIDSW